MLKPLKKFLLGISFNIFLLLFLFLIIQNSNKKNTVKFFAGHETINLPISFIVGSSFISGYLLGCLVPLISTLEKKNNK